LIFAIPLSASASPGDSIRGEVDQALAGLEPDSSADLVHQDRLESNQSMGTNNAAEGSGAPVMGSVGQLPTIAGFAVFPIAEGFSYTDTFGAPRSGGRTHAGIDIFAPKLTQVVAVADGVVVRAEHTAGRAGVEVVVEHPGGTRSYYLHLNNDTPGTDDGLGEGIAPGIAPGVAVTAGTVVGYVGDSGNAEATPAHLHFEFHVSGAGAVDPYTLLLAAERGEVGVLPLQALPFTGSKADEEVLVYALVLIVAGMTVIRSARQLELAIVQTGPVVTLAIQILLWRGRALDRLMGDPAP
jgi:murein DD-endopeptidase MepM/ murein hydrolase activator NlpD